MTTMSSPVPHFDFTRLPTAKSQRPARISRSTFLTQPPQPPTPSQADIDMDGTDMDPFGAGTGSSEIPQAGPAATPVPSSSKRAASEEASSGTKRARLDDVITINTSTLTNTSTNIPTNTPTQSPPKEKKNPQFAVGYVSGGKPKAADYEDVVQALLLRAMHEYESRIVGINAYPDSANQSKWTKICWKEACRVASEDYSMTERMSKMVCTWFPSS
jgi:hypothetical protein